MTGRKEYCIFIVVHIYPRLFTDLSKDNIIETHLNPKLLTGPTMDKIKETNFKHRLLKGPSKGQTILKKLEPYTIDMTYFGQHVRCTRLL